LNRRVRSVVSGATTDHLYDYAGRRISDWYAATPGNLGHEGVARAYWGNRQIAFRAGDGTFYFDHQDWTGTERLRTNYQGQVAQRYSSLPWGDGSTPNFGGSDAGQDNAFFTGLDFDTESDTSHAQFRNYSQTMGRWLTPDPYDGSYDFTNPQSFNRYAYVRNNPLAFTDPLGLDDCQGTEGGYRCAGQCNGSGCFDQSGNYYNYTDYGISGGSTTVNAGDAWDDPTGYTPTENGMGGWYLPGFSTTTTIGGSSGGGGGAPNNGQKPTSFSNCVTQTLKPQLSANLHTWLGQLKYAPVFGIAAAATVTGALAIVEPETLPVAPALFGVLAVNQTVFAADASTTYFAAKSILQTGAAVVTCGAQTF
jgi:RHS repeat-associated protein